VPGKNGGVGWGPGGGGGGWSGGGWAKLPWLVGGGLFMGLGEGGGEGACGVTNITVPKPFPAGWGNVDLCNLERKGDQAKRLGLRESTISFGG